MNDDLFRLLEGWRASRRAAFSADYAAYRRSYVRRALAYALVLESRLRTRR